MIVLSVTLIHKELMDLRRGFEPPVFQRPRIQSPIARPTSGAENILYTIYQLAY